MKFIIFIFVLNREIQPINIYNDVYKVQETLKVERYRFGGRD